MKALFCLLLLSQLLFHQPIDADNENFSIVRSFGASNGQGTAHGVAVDEQDGSIYFWSHRDRIARLTKLAANNTVLWSSQFVNQSVTGFNLMSGPNPAIDPVSRDVFVAGTTEISFDWQQVQPKIRPAASLIDNQIPFYGGTVENFSHALWISGLNVLYVSSSTVNSVLGVSGLITRSSSDLLSWTGEGWWQSVSVKNFAWSPFLQMMVTINGDNSIRSGPTLYFPNWLRRTAPSRIWMSTAWSEELRLFVAVAKSGIGDRVITSNNGVNWTVGQSAADSEWNIVIWAKGANRFLALSPTHAMISTDGVNWTAHSLSNNLQWSSVCYSDDLGLFVAVAESGTGNRAMTSTDGISWTLRSTPGSCNWRHVVWISELNLFVAVGSGGAPNARIMTSPNGIDWFPRPSRDIDYNRVVWAPNLSKLLLFGVGFIEIFEQSAETIFVSRVSRSTGSRVWTKFYGDAAVTRAYSMDQTNSSLIIGGTAIGNFHSWSSVNDSDCLLFSVSKNSNALEWSQVFGTVASDGIAGVYVSQILSSVYTTGWTGGNLTGINAGGLDMFVSRHFLVNGSQISLARYGSAGDDSGLSLVVNQPGSALYLAGYASGAVVTGQSSIVSVAHDQIIATLDPITLNLTWARFIGGIGVSDRAVGIAIHPGTGVIYSSGFISSPIVNNGSNFQKTFYGNFDLTLSALHPNGTVLWTRVAGSSIDDQGGNLVFNSNGVLFVAAKVNNSDGYLVHTLDATGNNNFSLPNATADSLAFSTCYTNPWMLTTTRTSFATVTSFLTSLLITRTNVITQTDPQTALSYLTSTETRTVTDTTIIISPTTVYQMVTITAGGSGSGVLADKNSADFASNPSLLIGIVLTSICLLMSGITIVLILKRKQFSQTGDRYNRIIPPSGSVLSSMRPQSIFGETVQRELLTPLPSQITANNLNQTYPTKINQSYTDNSQIVF